jgi:hypothetical protein
VSSSESASQMRVREMLERALAFTEKLLAENARLRKAVASAQPVKAGAAAELPARIQALEADLASARAELARPRAEVASPEDARRIAQLLQELAEERQRYQRLEEQNTSLANLYVASHELHATLDFKEVVAIVMEIVTNLVGAEAFALMLIDGRTDTLHAVAAEGIDVAQLAPAQAGKDGAIGRALKSGGPWFAPGPQGELDLAAPLAVIPLRIKERVLGAIVVWRLLPQKHGAFTSVDHELFGLLADHAATAIFASKLYGESERKLTTIQGFLDLLTTTS